MSEKITERLAAFKAKYGTIAITSNWADNNTGYVRISEYVDVEFPPLPKEDVLKNQIACIDKQIDAIKAESIKEINDLQQKKQELLALEHKE